MGRLFRLSVPVTGAARSGGDSVPAEARCGERGSSGPRGRLTHHAFAAERALPIHGLASAYCGVCRTAGVGGRAPPALLRFDRGCGGVHRDEHLLSAVLELLPSRFLPAPALLARGKRPLPGGSGARPGGDCLLQSNPSEFRGPDVKRLPEEMSYPL